MLGRVGKRIELEEIHRWPSRHVRVMGSERWDLLFIWGEILEGLHRAARRGERIESVSVDSWGVDYVYESQGGHPYLTPPHRYRDTRTAEVFARCRSDSELSKLIYNETGIQFLPFNTLYQLLSDRDGEGGESIQDHSYGPLLIADYFNMLLSGASRSERSLASTTQLYNPRSRNWSDALIERFQFLPDHFFKVLVDAGTTLGLITEEVSDLTGLPPDVQVIATCSHDTGAAVAATPIGDGEAYLSSGTWSLLGVERDEPVITEASLRHNCTNEVGYGHTIRLLKNLSGMFLIQECRRDFGDEESYASLTAQAESAEPLRSLIRPDAELFSVGGGMCEKIRMFCRGTNQSEPETPGQFVRCCYESLALLYAEALDALAEVTGERPTGICVVGGGSRATLLNQLAADACDVAVTTGPVEATALGNVGVQAIAAGTIHGLDELRDLVRRSIETTTFQPTGSLADAAERFARLSDTD